MRPNKMRSFYISITFNWLKRLKKFNHLSQLFNIYIRKLKQFEYHVTIITTTWVIKSMTVIILFHYEKKMNLQTFEFITMAKVRKIYKKK